MREAPAAAATGAQADAVARAKAKSAGAAKLQGIELVLSVVMERAAQARTLLVGLADRLRRVAPRAHVRWLLVGAPLVVIGVLWLSLRSPKPAPADKSPPTSPPSGLAPTGSAAPTAPPTPSPTPTPTPTPTATAPTPQAPPTDSASDAAANAAAARAHPPHRHKKKPAKPTHHQVRSSPHP
jgi:hypothetical protein